MGQGAFMVVVNLDSQPHHLEVNDVNCMQNGGESGSNLNIWNDVTIEPVSAIPAFGQPLQYIEADGSGGCAFEQSHFAIQFDQGGATGGKAGINIQTSVDGVPVDPRYVEGPIAVGLSATQNFIAWDGQAGVGIMRRPSIPVPIDPVDRVDPARWMGELIEQHPSFRSKQLNSISLPASHDSGMSHAGPCTSFADARVTQTQTLPLARQLEAGIRYFDLRPALWRLSEPGSEFAFGHFTDQVGGQGCLGEPMVMALTDVKKFLDDHPHEIAILKFSGYDDSDGNKFPLTTQQAMIDDIKAALGDQVFTASSGEKIGLFTIGEIVDGQKRAICVFQNLDNSLVDPRNGVLLFGALDCNAPGTLPGNYATSNFDLYDCYSDSENSILMIVDQISKYRKFRETELLNGEMFLLSHTLTLGTVDSTPIGANKSILEMAQHVNMLLWDVVTSIYPGDPESNIHRPPNLIYVDAVDGKLPILAALYLNSRSAKPLDLPRIAVKSTAFRNVYLRLDRHRASGEPNCQVGVGAFERFALERAEGDDRFYLKSVEFGVYLTLDAEGVNEPDPNGVGKSGFSETKVPAALFRIQPASNGTFTIESTAQAGLYLRMDGQNMSAPSPSGGGVVNGQFGAGPYETFVLAPA